VFGNSCEPPAEILKRRWRICFLLCVDGDRHFIGVPLGMLLVKQKELRTIALGLPRTTDAPSLALFGVFDSLAISGRHRDTHGCDCRCFVRAASDSAEYGRRVNESDPAVLEAAESDGIEGVASFC